MHKLLTKDLSATTMGALRRTGKDAYSFTGETAGTSEGKLHKLKKQDCLCYNEAYSFIGWE